MSIIPVQYRLSAWLLVVLAALIGGAWLGYTWMGMQKDLEISEINTQYDQAVKQSIAQAENIRAMRQKVSDDLSADLADEQAKEVIRTRIIYREVIKYETADFSGKCNLPVGWVRIDSASATGMPIDSFASGLSDDSPSGFTDSDALRNNVDRNIICRSEIAKLKTLQAWACKITGGSGSECKLPL